MIPVSQDFKNAIKHKDRQIKGYVEVLYDLPDVEVTPSVFEESGICQLASTYTDISEIVNNKRVTYNYGTLDYLPLDGTYLTMSDGVNENAGYITDNVANSIEAYYDKFILTFDETTINGITIYFKNNTPHYGTITFSDGTTKQITETENIYTLQVILDEPKTITGMTIQFGGWEWWQYKDRKIRIDEIDLGITQVYKDNELIEFTIDEEVNKLVEETPVNETTITLNNMSGMFDPLNPKGIVPYLTENAIIIPYIGVLTENLGIEYVKMGEFYFDSYTNNKDKTTTLIGKTLMKDLETELFTPYSIDILVDVALTPEELKTQLEAYYKYKVNVINYIHEEGVLVVTPAFFKDLNLINFLKQIAFMKNCLLYFDRNDEFNIKRIDTTIKDTFTKTELLEDVQFRNITKINKIIRKFETAQTEVTEEQNEIFSQTVILEDTTQDFLFQSSEAIMDTYPYQLEFSQEGGTSYTRLGYTYYFIAVRLTGNIGAEVTFKVKSHTRTNHIIEETNVQTDDTVVKGETLEYRSQLSRSLIEGNKFDYVPSYEMEFDYNGDPSLEAGDYISVETPYGYKNLFIQKNHFRFDGGLEGHIEGVE